MRLFITNQRQTMRGLVALIVALSGSVIASAGDGLAPASEAPDKTKHDVGIDQKRGDKIPLDLSFTDENGNEVSLNDCIGGKPSILIMAYYRCPVLCGEVLAGVLDAAKNLKTFTIGKEFNVVTVSFDPKEAPELALAKKRHFVNEYGRKEADFGWKFLTTKNKKNIDQLAAAVGFRYEYDKSIKEYNHASGIMIITPEGIISQYMPGIDYMRNDDGSMPEEKSKHLREALTNAGDGKIGDWSERIFLTCFRYSPHTGKYTANVKFIVQCGGVLTLLVIGVGLIRELRRSKNRRVKEMAENTAETKTEMDRAI
ncbi:SCO family protein [Zavarzinella formosa]|uniref:SCO family protein n=1 Tax=Zavarzinella formosa TaxID=360055 RepID=UPI000309C764|nr:SCO family protein [Zavarzinella formosa]